MFDIRNKACYILLLLPFIGCENGKQTRIQFIKIPRDYNLGGLKCAADHITTNRKVRYNYVTRQCDPLEEEAGWFPDLTIEENHNYFRLFKIEPPFGQGITKLPKGSVLGLVVVLHIQLLPVTHRFNMDFLSVEPPGTKPFHIGIRGDEQRTVYNHMSGGDYGIEDIRPYLFHGLTPSMYRLEFRINQDSVDTYLDGEMFYKFPQRLPISTYQAINIWGELATCHKIQYIYPL